MSTQQPNALARREVILEVVNKGKQGFIDRLPKDIDAERLFLGLVTLVQKRPDIAECDPSSIIIAGYEAAEIGINLNPALGLGYVVPYKGIATFHLGYRGMIQKGYEMGVAKLIFAEVVYDKDHFRRVLAPVRTVEHIPANGDRGEPIGAYSFVELRDGGIDFEYMTKEQIMRHRKHSKNPDSMMWTTFWEEGWRKTPIRVHFKRIPLTSSGMERFAEMIGRDNEKDFDFEPPPTSQAPEIRRATPPPVAKQPESPQDAATEGTTAVQDDPKPKGRGKRQPDAEKPAEGPPEAKSAPLASKEDIERFWKKAFSAGWSAYEVKKHLEAKGYADGKVANVPSDLIDGILREMESGGAIKP